MMMISSLSMSFQASNYHLLNANTIMKEYRLTLEIIHQISIQIEQILRHVTKRYFRSIKSPLRGV